MQLNTQVKLPTATWRFFLNWSPSSKSKVKRETESQKCQNLQNLIFLRAPPFPPPQKKKSPLHLGTLILFRAGELGTLFFSSEENLSHSLYQTQYVPPGICHQAQALIMKRGGLETVFIKYPCLPPTHPCCLTLIINCPIFFSLNIYIFFLISLKVLLTYTSVQYFSNSKNLSVLE